MAPCRGDANVKLTSVKMEHFLSILGTIPPPTQLLTIDDIFVNEHEPPKLETLRTHLFGEGRLTEKAALKIIEETAAILKSENNLIELEAPITGNLILSRYFGCIDYIG